jgi:hypothetical protein
MPDSCIRCTNKTDVAVKFGGGSQIEHLLSLSPFSCQGSQITLNIPSWITTNFQPTDLGHCDSQVALTRLLLACSTSSLVPTDDTIKEEQVIHGQLARHTCHIFYVGVLFQVQGQWTIAICKASLGPCIQSCPSKYYTCCQKARVQDTSQAIENHSDGTFSLIAADKLIAASSFFNRNKYGRAMTLSPSGSLDCASCENIGRFRIILDRVCVAHIQSGVG